MIKQDFEAFERALRGTAEAFDKELTAQRIAIYFDGLFDLDLRAVKFALRESIQRNTFFPTVAKLRELSLMWKAPALPQGKKDEPKMLESPEMREERAANNRQRLRDILASFETADQKYGTNLTNSKDYEARKRELERQAQEIREGAQ